MSLNLVVNASIFGGQVGHLATELIGNTELKQAETLLDSTPKVSVIICTRNRGASAVDAIASVLASEEPDLELLVIDQSTNRETEDAVAPFRTDDRFHYIASDEVGTGRARNMGLRAARGTYVLYTDDDCEVAANWIETMTSCFDRNARVAVVFSNVIAAPHDSAAGFVPTYVRSTDNLVTSLRQKCTARGIGAGMAVRRDAVLAIGGFDACLGPGTEFPDCEDGDIASRALLKGWAVYETSKTHVVHDGFRTWEQGKELTRRNWMGIGAAYAKPLRCGYWKFGIVVVYEAFWVAMLKPLRELLHLRAPRGGRSFYFFWKGFVTGWKAPIDRTEIRYLDSSELNAGGGKAVTQTAPTISIGLPVYNGEAFIEDAILDVLNQTWTDLELVISDNASTDRTQAICEDFAAKDDRIRYVRQPANRGAGWNFNEVLRLSRGKYFKWLAHDDRMDLDFLSQCVSALDGDPGVVLAYPGTSVVDEQGAHIEDHSVRLRTGSPGRTERFHDLVLGWSMCFEIFGLIRSDALAKTGGMGNFGHGDGVLLAQLGMLGRFQEVDGNLHISRRHAGQSMRQFGLSEAGNNDYHRYSVWFNPALAGRITFPHWRIGWEFYKTAWIVPSSVSERLSYHATMARWALRDSRHLVKDLIVAGGQWTNRLVRRRA